MVTVGFKTRHTARDPSGRYTADHNVSLVSGLVKERLLRFLWVKPLNSLTVWLVQGVKGPDFGIEAYGRTSSRDLLLIVGDS